MIVNNNAKGSNGKNVLIVQTERETKANIHRGMR